MSSNLFYILDSFAKLKILVIGEAMLDRYLKGSSSRLSQEAPVLVVGVQEREDIPGGAANTAVNLKSLGAEPLFVSVIGADEEGQSLRRALQNFGVSDEYIISHPDRQTLAKQRVLANDQMMIRFDQGSTDGLDAGAEDQVITLLEKLFPQADAVIISDYNYGILTPRILSALARLQRRDQHVLVVDAKNLKAYRDMRVTAVKPNYGETIELLSLEKKTGEERIEQISKYGPRVLDQVKCQIAAITMDQDGAIVFERDRSCYRVYARPATHNRVAGAGDTFMSALALALAAGAQTTTAAEIASAASSVVVEKPGTSTCYIEELKAYYTTGEKYITDNFHMSALIAAYRHQGKRIVFTNGCFDILHSGHIQYLNQAKALGDVLIVGINTDNGVTRLKGPDRPINPLEDRVNVMAGLSGVDHVIPFEDEVPLNLIRLIQPDVYVKGGDYQLDQLPEARLVEQLNGQVVILPYIENHSTTGIIERIRQSQAQPGHEAL